MTQVNESMANPKGNLETLKPYQAKWNSGTTRTIRVPVVLADQVLKYAHKLDDGEALTQVNDDSLVKMLGQVVQLLNEALPLKASAGGAIKVKVREALMLLCQVEGLSTLESGNE